MPKPPITIEIQVPPDREIFPVIRHVGPTLKNVAPERAEELRREAGTLLVRVTDSGGWACHLNLSDLSIEISRKVIEYLWASALVNFKIYDLFYSARADGSAPDDLANHPRLRPALNILQSVLEDILNETDRPWPPGPRPSTGVSDSDENVADELCLVAVGFVLHHELAHRRLRHVAGTESLSIQQEQDADQEAIRWLLDAMTVGAANEQKRSLGVATALGATAAIGIRTGRHGGKTHPRDFDRLFNVMDRYLGNDPEHSAWLLLSLVLKLHLDNVDRAIDVPTGEFETPRDAVNAYIDAIAAAVPSTDDKPA